MTLSYGVGAIAGNAVVGSTSVITPSAPVGGTFTASNYTINYATGTLTVVPATITITVNANQEKKYGAADPTSYAYGVSPSISGLAALNGTLTRVSGETVGSFAIQQNDLTTANNPNYTITYVGNNFTITQKPITISADPNQTKLYGTADPTSYAYTLSAPLIGSDVLTGALTRVAGETVGPYAISQGTLANANYTITYIGANFAITPKPITVTANANQTKIYGDADPSLYAYTLNTPLIGTDAFTGKLDRIIGENVGNYAIGIGTLANANYAITYIGANFAITAKPITITVNAGQSKKYGSADPAIFAYTTSPSITGLVSLVGKLTRLPGEDIGTYLIQQGDLISTNNPNYIISFIGDNFTIIPETSFFQIPNAFVPGSTNEFDNKFRIFANSAFAPDLLTGFSIFNRNGQLIKKFTGITDSWDGRGPDGNLLEADVYLWAASFKVDPLTTSLPRTGTFILLK